MVVQEVMMKNWLIGAGLRESEGVLGGSRIAGTLGE